MTHAYLGVATSGSSTDTPGARLASVTSGGPGADAGLRSGDVVTKLGDANVQNANDLVAAIASHRPGDKVAVTVERSSKTVQLTVMLGTQPHRAARAAKTAAGLGSPRAVRAGSCVSLW